MSDERPTLRVLQARRNQHLKRSHDFPPGGLDGLADYATVAGSFLRTGAPVWNMTHRCMALDTVSTGLGQLFEAVTEACHAYRQWVLDLQAIASAIAEATQREAQA